MYNYAAKVVRWIDGDTVEVIVDLGFRISLSVSLRVAGIDTPESHSPILEDRQKASAARIRSGELAPVGSTVNVTTSKPDSRDKYGRWLGDIMVESLGESLSAVLIREGLGRPYDGGKK